MSEKLSWKLGPTRSQRVEVTIPGVNILGIACKKTSSTSGYTYNNLYFLHYQLNVLFPLLRNTKQRSLKMVRVGPLLDRLLNAKNVVAFLLSIFTLLLRLRLVSFLAFGYLLVGCFYCWASVKVLPFLPPHLFVLLTDDFTVCASASRSSASSSTTSSPPLCIPFLLSSSPGLLVS